jgi:hypothetical protein
VRRSDGAFAKPFLLVKVRTNRSLASRMFRQQVNLIVVCSYCRTILIAHGSSL